MPANWPAALTEPGVRVARMTALPDDLAAVTEAFVTGMARADLVVLHRRAGTDAGRPDPRGDRRGDSARRRASTRTSRRGCASCGRRRDMPFPELNLKQAWLIPSAAALPNPNGTAPGWFVERPDGRVIVALPGPPREMRPMWTDHVVPRLRERGLGAEVASRTYRLGGDRRIAGRRAARRDDPARDEPDRRHLCAGRGGRRPGLRRRGWRPDGRGAVEEASAVVLGHLGDHVWATGDTTWSQAIGARLDELGWSLAVVEIGTGGSLNALLGDEPWLRFDESIAPDDHPRPKRMERDDLEAYAASGARARRCRCRDRRPGATADRGYRRLDRDLTPRSERRVRRLVFLTGPMGRSRAALAAAAVLLETLRGLTAVTRSPTDARRPRVPAGR